MNVGYSIKIGTGKHGTRVWTRFICLWKGTSGEMVFKTR